MNTLFLLAEKTIATYLEWLIGLYIADAADKLNTTTPQALALAAIPAALTVIANGLPGVPANLPFYVGLLLNAVRTFVAGFLGYMIALPFFTLEKSVLMAAGIACLPAALAVIKAGLASKVGDPTTPNVLPLHREPTTNAILVNEPQAA
jgi:hypothetical protein